MTKRIIALLLALILTVGLLPTVALAAGGDTGKTTPAETSALTPADGYYKFNGDTAVNKDAADITLSKTAKLNDDGTYTVTLTATAKEKVTPVKTKVVFVLDASGSMNYCTQGEPTGWGHIHSSGRKCAVTKTDYSKSRWAIATSAISTMVSSLPAGVETSFVYFTGDHAYTVKSANYTGVTPNNGTPLAAGLNKGIEQFENSDATNRVIILVADGETSDRSWGNAVYPTNKANEFKNGDGTIYTVGFTFSSEDFHSLSSGKDYQKNANNAGALNGALTEIREKIVGMISDPMGEMVTLGKSSVKVDKTASTATTTTTDTKIEWTDTAGLDGTVTLTYDVSLKPEVTERAGVKTIDLNGNATFNYSYKDDKGKTVSKSLPFPKPQATVYVASLAVKYRLESETGTEVNVAATSEISGTSHEVKQLPYTFEARLPAVGDTVTANGKTYYVKSVTGATDKANTPLEATVANADAHTITVVLTETAPTASYKVEHYKEKVDGTFPATADETDDLTGSTGAPVTATAKTYSGFTCDKSVYGTIESGTIAADGSLVLKLYYTRNSYTVTYTDGVDGAEVFADDVHNLAYGSTIPGFTGGTPTRADYTFNGWKWYKETDRNMEIDKPETMPAYNLVAVAQWKEKDKVTISYFAKEGGSVDPNSETLNPDTGVAKGSTAKANDGYRFVGWYSDEACTTAVLAEWVDSYNKLTPGKPEGGWANATYYAKFESLTYTITFETETGGTLTGQTNYTGLAYNADFPAAPTTTPNAGYYFDGWYKDGETSKTETFPATVTENATYTAKWTQYTPRDLDLTGKIQKTLNSDVALTNETFTINLTLNGVEVPSATATATVSATTASGTDYTGSAPFQKDDFKLNFTAPGIYNYSIVEEDGQLAGMTYDVGFANGHTMIVNVDENTTTNELYVKSVTIDGKAVYAHGETEATPTWLTITNNYVEPKETFDLNTLITKKFEAAADSKPIPDGSYTFKAEIVEADSSFGELVEGAKYEGTVTLNAADTASFDFGDDRYLKLAAGRHYYRVSEIGDTVTGTTGTITYDSRVFCLTIVVNDDGEVGSVNVTPLVVVYSTAEEAVEFEGDNHITFTNTYFEKKDPNSVTVDFSQLVCKKLTVTGSKAFTGATFEAVLDGEWHDLPAALSLEDASAIATYAHATPGAAQLHKTLTVSFDANDDLTQNKAFTGSITFNAEGVYTYTLKEVIPEGATGYDTSEFLIQLWIKANSDAKLEVKSVKIKYNNQWEDLNGIILFENTIDTGRDDYIPIIIPTIINKDTGMLNKTDHFAYVIGYPDGTVHPNGQITRAEVATIFFRLLRDEVRDGAFTTSNSYSDVAYGKWYNNPISTMSALGIITGYPDGTFKPNKPITRAEFAAIAARFDETQSGKSATFSDVIGHWAAKEIGIAYYNDWIKGYPDGTFKPDQNITRAEAMTLINRVLERKPESPADLLTNMNKWTDNMDTSKWYYLDVQEATNSHGYTRKTFNYELWRQMLPDPDWSRYER